MGLVVYATIYWQITTSANLNLFLAILFAVPVYTFLTLLLGAVDRDSLQKLPVIGPRLTTIFQRFI